MIKKTKRDDNNRLPDGRKVSHIKENPDVVDESEDSENGHSPFNWNRFRKKLYKMVSTGVDDDALNLAYDIISTAALIVNLVVTIMYTFDNMADKYGGILKTIEAVTVAFFAVDYFLRVFTAKFQYRGYTEGVAIAKYCFSLMGIIDLLSFLPYYLPVFFPSGTTVFRLFRVARIFRLFRINAYYDSLNVITDVMKSKSKQLLSSVFIILILMVASSLAMYSVEHTAQPEVFSNAFSGLWWAASTLLTVGYGDIYPITPLGQFLAIAITFLGVLMVAIPTGIISAGFVEQYHKYKKVGDYAVEEDIHFIEVILKEGDGWIGGLIQNLRLPQNMLIISVGRGNQELIPWGDLRLKQGDKLVIVADSLKNNRPVHFKEMLLRRYHPWVGHPIRDLNISRQTFVVMIKRDGKTIIPSGDVVLQAGDTLFLYSKKRVSELEQEVVEDL